MRHLFTGQQWYPEIGLYDLRNRFYSPDIGRFLQPDPIGFGGDRTNLYRYCGNNPVTRWDPSGLDGTAPKLAEKGNEYTYPETVRVDTSPLPDPSNISRTGFLAGSFGFGGFPTMNSDNPNAHRAANYIPFPRPPEDPQPSVEHSTPSSVPEQNPDPNATQQPSSTTITSITEWVRNNTDFTVDFAQTIWVVPIPAGEGVIPLPLGVHGFATVNKKGVTLGAGTGVVSGSGVIIVAGAPFGQSTGTQLVSQIFGAYGTAGGYISGTPLSQSGPSYSLGGGWGNGFGFSITVDGTLHFDYRD